MSQRRVNINPLTGIIGAILFLVLLYFIIKGAYLLLGVLTPVLLIAAAYFDWKVFPDHIKWIWNMLQENPIVGVLAAILSVALLPFTAGYLFAKAFFKNRIKKMGLNIPGMENANRTDQDEFVEYEEVEDFPAEKLELPEMEKSSRTESTDTDEYEQLFD